MRELVLAIMILAGTGLDLPLPVLPFNEDCKVAAQQKLKGELSVDEAIRTVQQHAAKANIDPSKYYASGCRVRFSWRVYLEPSGNDLSSGVFEYVLTARGGLVVGTIKLSGREKDERLSNVDSVRGMLSQEDAIAIANKDAKRTYDLANQQLTVCELKNFWRVIYAPHMHLNGGGPEYLIDKRTGVITDKKYYQ